MTAEPGKWASAAPVDKALGSNAFANSLPSAAVPLYVLAAWTNQLVTVVKSAGCAVASGAVAVASVNLAVSVAFAGQAGVAAIAVQEAAAAPADLAAVVAVVILAAVDAIVILASAVEKVTQDAVVAIQAAVVAIQAAAVAIHAAAVASTILAAVAVAFVQTGGR